MNTSSTPRKQSPSSKSPSNLHPFEDIPRDLTEHPEFEKLVRYHATKYIQKAVKEGRLQVRPTRGFHHFIPRMDILDDESTPIILATFEIPGVRPCDLKLEVVDGVLTVSGKRTLQLRCTPGVQACLAQQRQHPNGNTPNDPPSMTPNHRVRIASELRYGTFSRTLFLPRGIKGYHIEARLEQGMLTVTWPREVPQDDTSLDAVPDENAPSNDVIINAERKLPCSSILTTPLKSESMES